MSFLARPKTAAASAKTKLSELSVSESSDEGVELPAQRLHVLLWGVHGSSLPQTAFLPISIRGLYSFQGLFFDEQRCMWGC